MAKGCTCTECPKCLAPTVCAVCKACTRCANHADGCPGCPSLTSGRLHLRQPVFNPPPATINFLDETNTPFLVIHVDTKTVEWTGDQAEVVTKFWQAVERAWPGCLDLQK